MSTNTYLPEQKKSGQAHAVVPEQEWLAARKKLLSKEKEALRLLDELAEERRKLPWVKIEKDYVFDSPSGKVKLADLFGGRSQLLVYHFMFGPDWKEGCPSCSFVSDHFDSMMPHLAARDVGLVVVSRASMAKIEAFKQRMGWKFKWLSSDEDDFNFDFHVSFGEDEMSRGKVYYNYGVQEFPSAEAPGMSVFYKDEAGEIFHTYSTYSRGLDMLMGTYRMLDITPKGRDEDGLSFPMEWVRYHDQYGGNKFADADKPYWPKVEEEAGEAIGSACGCGSSAASSKAGGCA